MYRPTDKRNALHSILKKAPDMERPHCALCGSPDTAKLADKVRFGINKKIYRCKACDIVFLYPQMTEEEESEYYKDEYRKQFSYGSSVEEHFRNALPEAAMRRERMKHLLKKGSVVLEIGCASGYFLSLIRDLVAETHGVEPHIAYGDYAKGLGLTIFPDYVQCASAHYDVIFMFMTLEHLRDPVKSLKEIGSLLKKNGVLVIEVPNADDIMISTFNIEAFKSYYWQAPHNWYFSPKTLSRALDKAGFTTTLIPVQRYDLSNNIVWMQEGKPGGQGKYVHILGEELTKMYASVLCQKFLCDTIVAISSKKR